MDHTFKDRVDKVFASISSSSSSTPWSLTDAQVERRVWNRHKDDDRHNRDDDETPVSSSFDNLFNRQRNRRKLLDDPSDDDDDDDDEQTGGADVDRTENDGDEWDIRSSIGLDSTLDNEEEEDAYDKMAEGRENAGDRLYMKDVTDHGPYLNSHNVLPNSVHDVEKDPCADYDAIKARLEEDEAVGGNPVSSQGADEPMLNAEEPCLTVPTSGNGTRIKSILKRKNDMVVRQAKHVRFDSTCKNDDEVTSTVELQGFAVSEASENGRGVPDYIINPSKYIRYSLDDLSHDVNEGSQSEAYSNFLEQVKNSKHIELEQKSGESSDDLPRSVVFAPRKKRSDGEAVCKQSSTSSGSGIAALEVQQGEISEMQEDESHVDAVCTKDDLPRPVLFTPRKKRGDGEAVCKQPSTQSGSGIGIAALEVQQGEISEMQEDESHVDAVCTKDRFQKPSRRYRTKMAADDDVC